MPKGVACFYSRAKDKASGVWLLVSGRQHALPKLDER
jgi:hypothetical protein